MNFILRAQYIKYFIILVLINNTAFPSLTRWVNGGDAAEAASTASTTKLMQPSAETLSQEATRNTLQNAKVVTEIIQNPEQAARRIYANPDRYIPLKIVEGFNPEPSDGATIAPERSDGATIAKELGKSKPKETLTGHTLHEPLPLMDLTMTPKIRDISHLEHIEEIPLGETQTLLRGAPKEKAIESAIENDDFRPRRAKFNREEFENFKKAEQARKQIEKDTLRRTTANTANNDDLSYVRGLIKADPSQYGITPKDVNSTIKTAEKTNNNSFGQKAKNFFTNIFSRTKVVPEIEDFDSHAIDALPEDAVNVILSNPNADNAIINHIT